MEIPNFYILAYILYVGLYKLFCRMDGYRLLALVEAEAFEAGLGSKSDSSA
jgi:hypothetical protein